MIDKPFEQQYTATDVQRMLCQMKIYRFQVVYELKHSAKLPRFKGSMFRGALGTALIRTGCSCIRQRSGAEKNEFAVSQHDEHCTFGYLFDNEPSLVALPDHWTPVLASMQKPRPMIINGSLQIQELFEAGDRISFELTLFGDSIHHMPFLLLALKELGNVGVGSQRSKLDLTQVTRIDDLGNWQGVVYDSRDDVLRSEQLLSLDLNSVLTRVQSAGELSIRYMTPTRLKNEGLLSDNISFDMLFQSAYRRIVSLLAYYHSSSRLPERALYEFLLQEAKKIEVVSEQTRWMELERYSNRQKQKMNFGGIVGITTLQGNWEYLLPVLLISQWTGIGKSTVFGLGQIKILS